jgi:hypothetical protein
VRKDEQSSNRLEGHGAGFKAKHNVGARFNLVGVFCNRYAQSGLVATATGEHVQDGMISRLTATPVPIAWFVATKAQWRQCMYGRGFQFILEHGEELSFFLVTCR